MILEINKCSDRSENWRLEQAVQKNLASGCIMISQMAFLVRSSSLSHSLTSISLAIFFKCQIYSSFLFFMFLKIYPFTLSFFLYHICQYDEEHKNIRIFLLFFSTLKTKMRNTPPLFFPICDILKLIVSFTSFYLVSQ